MKIINTKQTRELDQFTIKNEPIASIDLMERAALNCANWIINRYPTEYNFVIVCGLGNNGGDGLAIARLLAEKGFTIEVYIICYSNNRSADFSTNHERLKLLSHNNVRLANISESDAENNIFKYNKQSIFIDALIGSGIKEATNGLVEKAIKQINQSHLPTIAIDMPSGLYTDSLNGKGNTIVNATYTLSFQMPKLSFVFLENAKYIGEFSILDIKLSSDFINKLSSSNYFITQDMVQSFLKTRSKIAHKGNFGHALLIAGSVGKMGAAILSAKACLRSGVGLLTVHAPICGNNILQTSVPEAMVDIDSEENLIGDNIIPDKHNAIGIGPGIGLDAKTEKSVKLLIQNSATPILFDADAINIISNNKTWLSFLPNESIFTPHLGEFERLAGPSSNSVERIELQREFSVKNSVYIVLKGAHTSISCPDGNIYFNSIGNPGMATGGSGDTLTGIITGLIAQGYNSQEACILGVYLHGLAGDFAAHNKTEEAMIASDIIKYLPEAYSFLKAHNN